MKSNYRRIGDYIREVTVKNKELNVNTLMGINIDKYFMLSVANTVGTDMSKYKIVKKGQFACNRMHVGRDKRLPVSLLKEHESIIVSPAYTVFEIIDEKILNSEYLMMWFSRKEFDREAWFYTDSDVRGGLGLDDFFNIEIPVPSIEKQLEIVEEYNTILDRIDLNEQMVSKLESLIQLIYEYTFKCEKDDEEDLEKYIETNPKISLKKGMITKHIEMSQLRVNSMVIDGYEERQFNGGSKFNQFDTLLARITPCLENGKTAFVNCLNNDEIGTGSTEFIVMRAKKDISPYWVYCVARDKEFRKYAISSMVGSSGRQRVHEDYLKTYKLKRVDIDNMKKFHDRVVGLFDFIKIKSLERNKLYDIKEILLARIAIMEEGN